MQFFKYEGAVQGDNVSSENDGRHVSREKAYKLAVLSEEFNEKMQGKAYFFLENANEGKASVGIIAKDESRVKSKVTSFLKKVGIVITDGKLSEITLKELNRMVRNASMGDFLNRGDSSEVFEEFGIDDIVGSYRFPYAERMIKSRVKKTVYEAADEYISNETLIPELDRIYANKADFALGHPVHYIVQTDDEGIRKGVNETLMTALFANRRLHNRRYCRVGKQPPFEGYDLRLLDILYKSCVGGAVVLEFMQEDEGEDNYASGVRDLIEGLCEVIKKYRNRVLTVLNLSRECTNAKRVFFDYLENMSFVELKEDFVYNERAEEFLKTLAARNNVESDESLFAQLAKDKGYLASNLRGMFDRWYANKLKTSIYPQYKAIVSIDAKNAKAEPKGNAYDELNKMIGLSEAKNVIKGAVDYYKAQKLFKNRGMKAHKPAMHMVFTGNPGTAKTSVARLFARIMKENGLLSKGTLVEVGRGDLVGKYVGWTAPTIKNKFREASGGVLFIDEAYSLVDDRSGSYGDEAINTIVQEMENHRGDMVVIFAGYPKEMKGFLAKNPGLSSRIAFHVPFADYDVAELCDIASLIASNDGFKLSDDAQQKLSLVFKNAVGDKDFGNGRYVRNVIEKARMAQAARLVGVGYDAVSDSDIMTILADDIALTKEAKAKERRIGFV